MREGEVDFPVNGALRIPAVKNERKQNAKARREMKEHIDTDKAQQREIVPSG